MRWQLQPEIEPEASDLGPHLRRRLLVVIGACAALVHGTLWWLYYHPVPKPLWGDERWYREAALQVLAGDTSWQLIGLWPPLYPYLEAGLMAVTGRSLVGIQIVQSVLLGLLAWVVGDLTRRLSGSDVAAFTAAGLTVAFPPLAAFSHYLWPEPVHLFLFMSAMWILVARGRSLRWSMVCGVALGLCLLTKSLLSPFVPLLLIVVALRERSGQALFPRERVQRAAALVVALACTVGPVAVTRAVRTGSPVLSDSSWFNLWVGLRDRSHKDHVDPVVYQAYRDFERSGTSLEVRNRVTRMRIHRHFQEHSLLDIVRGQLGTQYFRLFDKDSFLTDQLWGGVAREHDKGYVAAGRGVSTAVRAVSYSVYALVLAAAPFGWLVWRFRRRRWWRVLLLFVAYNLVLFFWFHVKTRFRVQMLPVFFIGCGCTVDWLRLRLRGEDVPLPSTGVRMTAIVLTVLFELFAFAGPLL
jgi:4-amino-4-deoxy-L-arabinose transferase-like glycosyltransferase